jgi:hypothetical protein
MSATNSSVLADGHLSVKSFSSARHSMSGAGLGEWRGGCRVVRVVWMRPFLPADATQGNEPCSAVWNACNSGDVEGFSSACLDMAWSLDEGSEFGGDPAHCAWTSNSCAAPELAE